MTIINNVKRYIIIQYETSLYTTKITNIRQHLIRIIFWESQCGSSQTPAYNYCQGGLVRPESDHWKRGESGHRLSRGLGIYVFCMVLVLISLIIKEKTLLPILHNKVCTYSWQMVPFIVHRTDFATADKWQNGYIQLSVLILMLKTSPQHVTAFVIIIIQACLELSVFKQYMS